MPIFEALLLFLLLLCAVAVSLTRQLWQAIILFMSYSLVMSVVWVLLQAPDLAMTEAAVGAGITSILFFLALKRINVIRNSKKEGPSDHGAQSDQ